MCVHRYVKFDQQTDPQIKEITNTYITDGKRKGDAKSELQKRTVAHFSREWQWWLFLFLSSMSGFGRGCLLEGGDGCFAVFQRAVQSGGGERWSGGDLSPPTTMSGTYIQGETGTQTHRHAETTNTDTETDTQITNTDKYTDRDTLFSVLVKQRQSQSEEFGGKHLSVCCVHCEGMMSENLWLKYCILIPVCLDFIFSFIAPRTTFHVCPGSPFKETNYSQSVYQS